jgi:DNA polymerase III subunit beta
MSRCRQDIEKPRTVVGVRLACDATELAEALSVVSRALPARSSLPVLGTVLLDARGQGLELTATNLEFGIRRKLDADVLGEGAAALPGRLLTDFTNAIGGERLEIELTERGDSLGLRSESFRTEIRCMDADEFPPTPSPEGGRTVVLSARALVEAITDTLVVASTDEARPVLTGLFLQVEGNALVLAASDGYRLAERSVPVAGAAPAIAAIVPSRAMGEVARLFRGTGGDLEITLGPLGNQVFFCGAGVELTSRVIDGSYPNYRRLIPETAGTSATLDAGELGRRLRALTPFAQDSAHVVRLGVTPRSLVLRAATIEVGSAETELAADVAGPETSLALNARYLLDCLSTAGERIELQLHGPLGPAVVRRPGGDPYVYLVMPVRYAV